MASQEKQKKSKIRLLLLAIPILSVIAVCALLLSRPDFRYLIRETVTQTFSNAAVTEISSDFLELSKYSLSDLSSDSRVTIDQSLLLINQDFPLEETFEAEVSIYQGNSDYNSDNSSEETSDNENSEKIIMNTCIQSAYQKLSSYIAETYHQPLYVRSAYRTAEEQSEQIEDHSDVAAALGASEHQAGLALDVYVPYYAGRAFIKTPAGQYVNSYCWKYGFIIRYPYYGQKQTGITYEPWHIRYVGFPHAEIIYKNKMTLESYLSSLSLNTFYQYENYLITRQADNSEHSFLLPDDFISAVISPDHQGNFVFTFTLR